MRGENEGIAGVDVLRRLGVKGLQKRGVDLELGYLVLVLGKFSCSQE